MFSCLHIYIKTKGENIMNKALRKAIIAGNWKMNKNRKEAAELIEALKPIAADKTCGVVICVPFTNLETALRLTEGTNIEVGAENVHFEKSGAFTGEISADMLTEMGVKYVIIGHSERKNVVIAYEPVWAIGTGKTATAEQAEEVCAFIRKTVAGMFGQEAADGMTIQYGGSMNEKNCAELLTKENIDGGLIGGASLVAEKFGVLLEEASK